MTKLLLTFASFILGLVCSYGQVSQSISVSQPGSLSTLIGDNKTKVTDLTLMGTINATDFTTIKQMTALKNLDMSQVSIDNNTIPAQAFQNRVLNSLVLPEGLTTIGNAAFRESNIKEGLVLPSTLSVIEDQGFWGVPYFIDFSKSKSSLETVGWIFVAFYTGSTELDFSEFTKLKRMNTGVWDGKRGGAFSGYTGHVILPKNLEVLPSYSFARFTGTLELPSSLRSIGERCFNEATMTELILPEGLETIGLWSFSSAQLGESLVLPSTLKEIKDLAFWGFKTRIDFSKAKSSLETVGWAFVSQYAAVSNVLDFSNFLKLKNMGNGYDAGKRAGAFAGYTGHVILPKNLEVLPAHTFAYFKGTVELPSSLRSIGERCFNEATMTELTLPEGLETIGLWSFSSAQLGESLVLPSTLKEIKDLAFWGFKTPIDFSKAKSSLETVGWAFVSQYASVLNVLDFSDFTKLKNMGNGYDAGKRAGAFAGYTGHVVLPKNLEVLPAHTFAYFKGTVELPSSLRSIGERCFNEATMTELILPEGLETIGLWSFSSAQLGESLVLPSTLKEIKDLAFWGFKTPIDFSKAKSSLETVGWAFVSQYASVLNVLDFSDFTKLKNMGNGYDAGKRAGAFAGYTGHVILPKNLEVLPAHTFAYFKGTFVLPEGLLSIGNNAFQESTFKQIDLPSTVTSIGANAFYNCTALETIISRNETPPSLGSNVFYGVNKTTCKLYVPYNGVELYQAANQWKDFLIGAYSQNIGLAESNLYRVEVGQEFVINMPVGSPSDVRLGLYSLTGIFVEDILQSLVRNVATCAVSIDNGSYIIQPYILENGVRKEISRETGSHNIDRLPLTVVNNWNTMSVRNTTINNNLLFATGVDDLLEVTNDQMFNVLVRYTSAGDAIKLGLFDTFSGELVADVTQSVAGNNYTCKVPEGVAPGKYNLIPYQLVSGKPVFVERSAEAPYLIDRLPLSVVVPTNTRALESVFETSTKVSIYPNPVTDVLNVSGEGVESVSVYDMNGRQVATANSSSISVSDLNTGTYVVKVKTTTGESTHKVMKK